MENVFKKLSLCIFLAVMIQLVFVVSSTQQSELNRAHPAELNSLEDSQTDNRRLVSFGDLFRGFLVSFETYSEIFGVF